MLRTMICGLGLAWATTATAQTPVSVHPATLPGTVVPAPASQPPTAMPSAPASKLPATKSPADMSRPLGEILQTPLPTSPTVPPPTAPAPIAQPAQTATPAAGCSTCATATNGSCTTGGGGRNLLSRLKDWLCYKPGPRVLPILTPIPYTAPIRAYFPCQPQAMGCGQAGGSGQAAGCAPAVAGRKVAKAETTTCTSGRCGTPFLRGYSFGLFGGCDPCRDSLLDRVLGRFTSDRGCHPPVNCLSGTCGAGGVAITTPASGPLNCSVGCPPATSGVCGQRPYAYRFANPLCPPTAPGYGPAGLTPPPANPPANALPTTPTATPVPQPTAPTHAVNKPFTNP